MAMPPGMPGVGVPVGMMPPNMGIPQAMPPNMGMPPGMPPPNMVIQPNMGMPPNVNIPVFPPTTSSSSLPGMPPSTLNGNTAGMQPNSAPPKVLPTDASSRIRPQRR